MSSNTDFFSQLANEMADGEVDFQDHANGQKLTGKAKEKLVNIDLSLHAGSILVASIEQICQGVIGRFFADRGGLEAMVRSKEQWDEDWKEDMHFRVREAQETIAADVETQIRDAIEARLQPRSQSDALRARVEEFSLLDEPSYANGCEPMAFQPDPEFLKNLDGSV